MRDVFFERFVFSPGVPEWEAVRRELNSMVGRVGEMRTCSVRDGSTDKVIRDCTPTDFGRRQLVLEKFAYSD
jgi:hypothetical protein